MKASWQHAVAKVAVALLAVAAVGACAADAPGGDVGAPTGRATGPAEPTEPTGEPTELTEEPTDMDDDAGQQRTISGTLDGDPVLEGGCAWVDTGDGQRYEVMWPDGYRIEWEPMQLVGPDDEVVARSGDQVEVVGSVDRDMASICMVGTIFSATEVSAP